MQSKLQIAGKKLTLSYHKDLLDDHVPLVRDVLADGLTLKYVFKIEIVIDVGAKQSLTNDNKLTTLAQLKTALEADGITKLNFEGGATDLITHISDLVQKAIKYAGSNGWIHLTFLIW